MKTVFLLRHGEAQEEDYDSDYARRLTERGKLRSSIMADHLLNSSNKVEFIISSGAPRARCTAEIIQNVFKLTQDSLVLNDTLYNAHDPWLLMDLIWNCSNSISSLMIVGHNPVLTELAYILTGNFRTSMEMGSVVKIGFNVDKWEEVESSKGTRRFYKIFSKGEIVEPDTFN